VVALLLGFATASWAVQAPLPWSFVNGAGKGYSIKLISSSPEPGAGLHPGQSVEFKVDLSYTLEVTDEGSIVLVFQDDSDKSLKPGSTQQHVDVKRGAGSVTLQDTLVVPEGVKEIRLFIPIVPKGMSTTSGEMILRYPVVTEVHSSTIGYPTVEAALTFLSPSWEDWLRQRLFSSIARAIPSARTWEARKSWLPGLAISPLPQRLSTFSLTAALCKELITHLLPERLALLSAKALRTLGCSSVMMCT